MSLLSKVLIRMPIILRLVALFPAFSDIEASMQATLWHFAGVSTPTAQAVFSGTRIEGAMQFINRIAELERKQASLATNALHPVFCVGGAKIDQP